MKQLSALGARRHAFFRSPRRMRPLGGRLDESEMLGSTPYTYYGGEEAGPAVQSPCRPTAFFPRFLPCLCSSPSRLSLSPAARTRGGGSGGGGSSVPSPWKQSPSCGLLCPFQAAFVPIIPPGLQHMEVHHHPDRTGWDREPHGIWAIYPAFGQRALTNSPLPPLLPEPLYS